MTRIYDFFRRWSGNLGLLIVLLGLSPEAPAIHNGWSGIWWWEPGTDLNLQFIAFGFALIILNGFDRIVHAVRNQQGTP